MSNSFKKNPSSNDYGRTHTRSAKRRASKKVRRYGREISNGSSFKEIYCSWDIHDYRGLCIADHENEGRFDWDGNWRPTPYNKEWEKKMKRK